MSIKSFCFTLLVFASSANAAEQTLEEVESACEDDRLLNDCIKSVDAFQASKAAASEKARAFRLRGLRYHDESGLEASAIADYTSALAIEPSANAYYNRALLLRLNGQRKEALSDLEKAVEIRPNYGLAWIDISMIVGDDEKYDEAIQAATNAVERDPDLTNESKSMAWNNISNSSLRSGRLESAREAAEKAIAFNAQNAASHRILVRYYILKKDKRSAQEFLDRAIRIDPSSYYNDQLRGGVEQLK